MVPLTEEALRELKTVGPGVGLVFGRRDYRAVLRGAAKRAGIPDDIAERLANHAVRHSRLTDLASRSKNIAAIQHMAGHRDLASTMRYVHGSLEGARMLLAETEKDTSAEAETGHSGEHSGEQEKGRPSRSGLST